jgi:hypothetical protein
MKLKETERWLTETIRNPHYFANPAHPSAEDRAFKEGYRASYVELRDSMSVSWTREEYLEWVRVWKLAYRKLSSESRMAKNHRKSTVYGDKVSQDNIRRELLLSWYADQLLELRKRSKSLAAEAYLAKKASEIVAA